jgi:hypothetical protein
MLVLRIVVVQILPGATGVCQPRPKLTTLASRSKSPPPQSSEKCPGPGIVLSTENCALTPTKLFAGTNPQSTGCGELVLLNEHERPENTAEITVVFVGGVPGRTRIAGARFATDPALFTAWIVRKHIPPSTVLRSFGSHLASQGRCRPSSGPSQ